MEKNNQYTSMVRALEDLASKGYSVNFSVKEDGILDDGKGNTFSSKEVQLDEFHRFEGATNPSDSSILYAVKTYNGLKGTVVDSYGADASLVISKFMNQIKQKQYD